VKSHSYCRNGIFAYRIRASLSRFGTARKRAQSRIASSVRLTPAVAVVVTMAIVVTMAVVVTPAATAIVVAKAAVMTVESVRVATPPRVPEFTWAPLRERPGLGLGHASRLETHEPEAR
jgi:hypothetical protein